MRAHVRGPPGTTPPKEFAAHGIESIPDANRNLVEHYQAAFNEEFAVPAAEPGTVFVPQGTKRTTGRFYILQIR